MRIPALALAVLVAVLSGSVGATLSNVPTPSHSPSPATSPRDFNMLESDPRLPAGATILPQGPTKTRVRRLFTVDPSKVTDNLAASSTATQSVAVADGTSNTTDNIGQCEDLSERHSCMNN